MDATRSQGTEPDRSARLRAGVASIYRSSTMILNRTLTAL